MEITLQVPEELGRELEQNKEQAVEILGLILPNMVDKISYPDENAILGVLANQASPQEILALKLEPAVQERVSELLRRNKDEKLSSAENRELDRYLLLDHLVRLAKIQAFKKSR